MQGALGDRKDIARLHDVRLEEVPYYLSLEYTACSDLHGWAEGQSGIDAIPLVQWLELTAQVAEALGAANSIGILHKDIKPRNVLMEEKEDGSVQPKLTDFGIGQLVNRDALKEAGIRGGFTRSSVACSSASLPIIPRSDVGKNSDGRAQLSTYPQGGA